MNKITVSTYANVVTAACMCFMVYKLVKKEMEA